MTAPAFQDRLMKFFLEVNQGAQDPQMTRALCIPTYQKDSLLYNYRFIRQTQAIIAYHHTKKTISCYLILKTSISDTKLLKLLSIIMHQPRLSRFLDNFDFWTILIFGQFWFLDYFTFERFWFLKDFDFWTILIFGQFWLLDSFDLIRSD